MAENDQAGSAPLSARVRALLEQAFGDEELGRFCYDYFRPVYQKT
jgi:hypothetical protein